MASVEEPTCASTCGYCTFPFEEEKTKLLPLQCRDCHKLFHIECMNCEIKPTVLYGDQLFDFECSFCSHLATDSWRRLNLTWVHTVHLVLYNLMVSNKNGRNGFFRWNSHICKFIENHWTDMMPCRNKTSSWQCTVAGTLSLNCPAIFCSGTQTLGEAGWWSLQEMTPPKLKDVLKSLTATERYKNRPSVIARQDKSAASSYSSALIRSRKRAQQDEDAVNNNKKVKEETTPIEDTPSVASAPPSKLNPLTPRQEDVLLNAMSCVPQMDHATARLYRKLKVHQKKRSIGCPIFNLDKFVQQSLLNTEHYASSNPDELPHPIISANSTSPADDNSSVTNGYPLATISKAVAILKRLDNPDLPILVPCVRTEEDQFISPYTSHYLMPHIFRSRDFTPPKIQIFQELMSKQGSVEYEKKHFTFSYFRKHHLASVNALISYFFWPVDLTEYLQYPDFTVVVLYGDKLCIGCGFMTPDVSVSEAYIPFLLVHPDFRSSSIGQIMLYHLIQSCQGKDVILHVSVNNPAMLLYQKFGFKAEEFCVDFYDRYYPPKYHLSKHAFLMRLKR